MRAKITRIYNDDLDMADTVRSVNNFLNSLFSQVDVLLNDTLITSSTNIHAYRAYIETPFSYGMEAKSSQLTFALFHKDEADTPRHTRVCSAARTR
jgi:hypothetical protein